LIVEATNFIVGMIATSYFEVKITGNCFYKLFSSAIHKSRERLFYLIHFGKKMSGVLLVVPLDLAITPMRVLQDPLIGPECRALFEEGEVDDRFLMILFLTLERLRNNSSWKPYVQMHFFLKSK
jgi:hypothetical protein